MSSEYIAFSCTKMFSDDISRKIRVLSVDARSNDTPVLIAEVTIPADPKILVSP